MNRKTLLIAVLLIICVSFTLAIYFYVRFQESSRPSLFELGSYMTYEQFFVWDEYTKTDYMTWNITQHRDDFAELYLTSHGVNVTEGNVVLTRGQANFTINVITREIVTCSETNYVGEKWPFWIETNATHGSIIDILYGLGVVSKSEPIYVLGKQRDCWVVEYNWTTAEMTRWYDKSSGICLKIHVVLNQQDVTIQITETAVLTDIDLELL